MSLNIFAKPDGVKARLMRQQRQQVPVRIFARPDRGTAQSARLRLTDVINVDRTAAVTSTVAAAAEIATLRQKLAAVYCKAILSRDHRIGLDGTPAEPVDMKAKNSATKRLARHAAKQAAAPAKAKPRPVPPAQTPMLRDQVRAWLLRRRA